MTEDEPVGVFGSVRESGDHAEALLHTKVEAEVVLALSHEKVPLWTARDGDPHKQAALSTARAVKAMEVAVSLVTPSELAPRKGSYGGPRSARAAAAPTEAALEQHFPGMFTSRGTSTGGAIGALTPRPPSKPSANASAVAWAAAQGDCPSSARPFTRPAPRKVHVPTPPPPGKGVLGLPLECTAAGLQDALTPRRTHKQHAGGQNGVRIAPRMTTEEVMRECGLQAWASTRSVVAG